MKNIGAITFHSAYNYGSCLQAYALQEFCKKIAKEYNENINYEIINLRLGIQKELYSVYRKKMSFTNMVKNLLTVPYKSDIAEKNKRFEKFINEKLNLTKEYSSMEELERENFNYDYYISGSDQLWNTTAPDFSWAYYLPFVKSGKKISYAASFGSVGINEKDKSRILNLISNYSNISVREDEMQKLLEKLINKKVELNVDPTMLLDREDWKKLINENNENKYGKYILFYTLYPKKEVIKQAKEISKLLKLPIIVTKFNNEKDYFNSFKKIYNTGPIEFLKLIDNAELVLSSSFHGNIFSILLEKPFLAIKNGKKDMRLETLLRKMNLEDRIVNEENFNEISKKVYDISFKKARKILDEERKKSKDYLKNALEFI